MRETLIIFRTLEHVSQEFLEIELENDFKLIEVLNSQKRRVQLTDFALNCYLSQSLGNKSI